MSYISRLQCLDSLLLHSSIANSKFEVAAFLWLETVREDASDRMSCA
jgi:hypothetical protein